MVKYSENPDAIFEAHKQIKFIIELHNNWNHKVIQELSEKTVSDFFKKTDFNNDDLFITKFFDAKNDDRHSFSFNVIFQKKLWTLRDKIEPFYFEYTFDDYLDFENNKDQWIGLGGKTGDYSNWQDLEEKFVDDKDFMKLKKSYLGGTPKMSSFDQPIFLKRPRTLNEFISIWDQFSPPVFIYIPKKLCSYLRVDIFDYENNYAKAIFSDLKAKNDSQSKNKLFYLHPRLEAVEGQPRTGIKLNFKDLNSINTQTIRWPHKDKTFTHEFISYSQFAHTKDSPDENIFEIIYEKIYLLRIPIFTTKIELPIQKSMLNAYNFPGPLGTGKFMDVFSELYEETTELRDLKITDLEKFIYAQKKKAGGNIELFGAKFPAGSINLFGTIVILCVQFYFWINLKNLVQIKKQNSEYSKKGFEFPWIAIYTDYFSRTFTIITYLLPIFVTFYLIRWISILSLVLCILTIISWIKLINDKVKIHTEE